MSKRSLPRRPPAPCPTPDPATDPEAIALRVHQIAATAGVLAEGQEPPLSHAIYLLEASLLEIEQRVERLRRVPR
jgi:hypothetical protein